MQENYLKYLISKSKKFAQKKEIFDIILYGSFVKGKEKPEDIDILLIFEKTSLKERTEIAHEFKILISKKFDHNKKTKFTYALIGRRKEKGILKQLNILSPGRGVFEVSTENSLIFEEFLTKWNVVYTKKNILISQI